MAAQDRRSGWLPPQPADVTAPPPAPEPEAPPRPEARPGGEYRATQRPPSSPVAVVGIVVGATGLAVLVLGVGVTFMFGILLGAVALLCAVLADRRVQQGQPGRPGQIKAARRIGIATFTLSAIAMVVWSVLTATGYSPQDFQQTLMDQLDRMRERQ